MTITKENVWLKRFLFQRFHYPLRYDATLAVADSVSESRRQFCTNTVTGESAFLISSFRALQHYGPAVRYAFGHSQALNADGLFTAHSLSSRFD